MNYGAKYRLAEPFQYLEENLVFFAPYSGNAPYQTNFLGSPHSLKGQVGTQTGGVLYKPGVPRYDGLTSKAASFGRATTNMWTNPSCETNIAGYNANLGAVLTRVAGISEIGAYSIETVTPGAAISEGWYTTPGLGGMPVVAGQNYTFSIYLKGSGTVFQRIDWFNAAGVNIGFTAQAATALQTDFTRTCFTATAPALAAFACVCVYTNVIQAITFYADAIQFENSLSASPYLDGSLGTGYAWTGAAHASTSTRAAAYIDYNNLTTLNNFVNEGTFSFWIKLDSNPAPLGYIFRINSSVTGNVFAVASTAGGLGSVDIQWGGGAGASALIGGNYNGSWVHVAATYEHSTIKLYINGMLISSAISVNNWVGALSAFRVGDSTLGGLNLDGCVDDFAMFDRALTEGEIKEIHHFGYSIGAYESDGCNLDPAFVANYHCKANITHIYIRSNAGAWSNNLMTEPLPFLLLPAAPVAGDAIYFGCDTLALDSGFFSNIIFNIQGGGANGKVVEYWNGAGWAGAINLLDGTSSFMISGKNALYHTPQAAWVAVLLSTAIAGAPASAPTGYWLRIRMTTVTTPPLQLDYYPFANTWPYFDVCEDSIEGDYEALLKLSERHTNIYDLQSLLIGNRSLDRGDDFDDYLNCSDEQNSDFVTAILVSASSAFANSSLSATGRAITYAPGAVAINEDVFLIRVMNNNYKGTYRIMLFASANVDSTANFRVELEPYLVGATSYPIAYTQWSTISATATQRFIDYGQITIPEDIGREPTVNGFNLVVHVDKDDLVNATWTFFAIVLLPNDELAIEAFDDNLNLTTRFPACSSGDYLHMDSAEDQKVTTKSEAWTSTTGVKLGIYRSITRGAIEAPPRHALRFWHKMNTHYVITYYLYQLTKVYLYDAERYIGLRGDR